MLKSLSIIIYNLLIKFIAGIILATNFLMIDFHNVFWLLIAIMFLPEVGFIFSKNFRHWLKDGIEGNDGKFEKDDLRDLLRHYSTLNCIRLYVLFGLLEAFYGIEVRETLLNGSLIGAFGLEAIGFFKGLKKEKDDNGRTN